MDIATLIGFVGGVAMVLLGVFSSGSSIGGIIDVPSLIIVVGGSYMALFVSSPLKVALGLWGVIGRTFKTYDYGEKTSVQNMVNLAEKARREGILALEEGLEDIDDKFLKEGLRLMVDGSDGAAIRSILENEMAQTEARHMEWAGVVTQWAGYAPGWGMMGTVIGLIGMLNNLEDKSSLGPNMAVALITTLYGSMLANWLFGSMATKLIAQNTAEMNAKEMILEGILSIQTGDNPRILAQKLLTYLDPKTRKTIESDVLKD
ncbi:MAG: motility protein A [Treponema sp.]|nr:motility protein A [Spirochaetia bacterium]MDD7013954.1 motility protein A [Spirochaetales bacterium]MDY4903158.1 motility protein A [Treponema sp.]